LTSEMRR